ncbi:MAG TPA: hypothetical protein PKA93_00600 [Arachnia sp.]|nr:hypothetical protein [Arachnia sp.]
MATDTIPTAADLERSQKAAFERTRATREEAVALLAQARLDADGMRSHAREMLDAARSEVAGLAERRDNITAQLHNLSGVIEALAVNENPTPNEEN